MRVTLCQTDIIWGQPQANREAVERMLSNVSETDLVILPEMFSTGFVTVPEGMAENAPSESLEWMKKTALQRNCAIAGSIALCEDGRYFNRLYFVKPDGEFCSYDKKHLFSYAGEHLRFTPGQERVIVEWKGLRILLSVCYDLRFPVWLRNRSDYDLLLCVASWPTARRKAWDALLKARAIENQCLVAAVNRTGSDPSCTYNGGSVILDALGECTASCRDSVCEAVSADLDLHALRQLRGSFPVLEDRDPL